MSQYSLGMVQAHVTQFDGPLFNYISSRPEIDLTIYYTTPTGGARYDREVGSVPVWDNVAAPTYRCVKRKLGALNALRFTRQIGCAGHDLVVVAGYSPLYYLGVACYVRLRGGRVGLRSDTILATRRSDSKSLIKEFVMPWIMKLYATGHPTGSLAEQYLRHYGFPEEQLFAFPYVVDTGYLSARCARYRARRKRLRSLHGIPEDAFVVLGVLKLVEREDPLTLLTGFAKLRVSFADAQLILVGDGPLRGDLEAFAETNSIGNVHMPGYVSYSRLALYYGIADVFVHPPVREPWGVSVNEAMACGLPVVAADTVGSHVDLIRSGETGFVFKSGNADDLAERLAVLCSDRELCRSMGPNARAHIGQWSHDCVVESLLDALRVAADNKIVTRKTTAQR